MNNIDILISLGHNSSAIGIYNNQTIGYEEERLTRIKACSNFPEECINKILKDFDITADCEITFYISHWFDYYDFYKEKLNYKHYSYDFIDELRKLYKNVNIISLSKDFTHHDAHAYSILEFVKCYDNNSLEDSHVLVIDGFGNNEEVFTLYKYELDKLETIYKVNGYKNSLGLLYQYATSYCGMKENQDEYKFLGYESHITSILSGSDIASVVAYANHFVSVQPSDIFKDGLKNKNVEIDVELLNIIKQHFYGLFDLVLYALNLQDADNFKKRVIIGFFIQCILEKYVEGIIKRFNIKKLYVAGGLFYNVKLNNRILNMVDKFSVIPLAGDQGATIGLYVKNNHSFNFNNLFLGKRSSILKENVDDKYIKVFSDKNEMANFITDQLLNHNSIVNVFYGNMEYGPRALCNTTTLAQPTKENVDVINALNSRDTVMPMAPIMLSENLSYFFDEEEYKKVIGSLNFMIVTLNYRVDVSYEKYGGIMHNYPLNPTSYSGRPQVISNNLNNHYIYDVLNLLDKHNIKALINTSFNVHGNPICYSVKDVINDFYFQLEMKEKNNISKNIYLVIFQGDVE